MENKKIKFTYDGHEITLEYTRDIVSRLERSGLVIGDLGKMPQTVTTMLYEGAFLANHRKIKDSTIKEIWRHIKNKEDFVSKLAEMYIETRDTLFDEPDEDDEKNVSWEATF